MSEADAAVEIQADGMTAYACPKHPLARHRMKY